MKCIHCSGSMSRKRHEHTTVIGRYKVNDASASALVCKGCSKVLITLRQGEMYELRASATVLADAMEIGGAELKDVRRCLGLKQTELAALLGVTSTTLSKFETEAEPMPKHLPLTLRGIVLSVIERGGDVDAFLEAERSKTSDEVLTAHAPEPMTAVG